MKVKVCISYPVSWALYWLGHVASKIDILHRVYSWLMAYSVAVQDWGGDYGPWEKKAATGNRRGDD